jgi:tetratricopeptide (TPR) repeat protein
MNTVSEHEAARRAKSLEAHGFRRAAIDVLEAAIAQEPDAGPLWRLRSVLLHREGRREEAFADVQQAFALSPLGPTELLILAEGYARRGFENSAFDVYEQLAADESRPHEMWVAIFAGLWQLKRWQAALNLCRRAAQQRPDDDAVFFAMSQALVRMGRPAEMIITVLQKAIDLNPADSRYRVLLATQLLRLGKHREAYKCVAELPPNEFGDLSCACCGWKLLRLCVSYGDVPRAAVFGAQLATLAATARSSKRGNAYESDRDAADRGAGE